MKTNTMRGRLALALSWVTLGAPVWGAGAAATLTPVTGTVRVDGHAIAACAALTGSSLVTLDASGTAQLLLPGSAIVASSKTEFRLEESSKTRQLRLTYGKLSVNGTLPVAIGAYIATPETRAEYQIVALRNVAYMVVASGTVDLASGSRSNAVRAGEAVRFDAAPQASSPAPKSGSAAASSGISTGVLVGVVAAATVAAGFIAYAGTQCTSCVVSASQP